MLGIVAVDYVTRRLDGMQLQSLKMLSAGRTDIVGPLTERALEMMHLGDMDGIQADVKEETRQDQAECS